MSTPESSLTQSMTLPEFIDRAGDKLQVPKALRDAIFEKETGFEHYSRRGVVKTSPKGALGISQLMPDTARRLGVNPHDPLDNAYGGLKEMKRLYDKYLDATGDEKQAALLTAAGYNAGEGAVEKYKGIPPYAETQDYVRFVAAKLKGANFGDALRESEQGHDNNLDQWAGVESGASALPMVPQEPGTAPQRRPSITEALDKLNQDVTERTARIKPTTTVTGRGMARTSITGLSPFAGVTGSVDNDTALPVDVKEQDSGIGALRQRDDKEVARRERIGARMTREQAAANKTGLPGLPAYDMGQMSPVEREVVITERARVEREQEDEQARQAEQFKKDKPEIDRLTKEYRTAIKASGLKFDSSKWTAEMLANGIAPLVGKIAGLGRMTGAPGTEASADAFRIHAEALRRAAEAEGAGRHKASRIVQHVAAGFIGTAPEMALMSVGVPAPVVFGAGSAVEAYGTKKPVVPAAAQGVGTGLAFEIPGVGQGVTKAVTSGAATGLGTAGIDLASGSTPEQALESALTNAIMRGAPAVKTAIGERSARQSELPKVPEEPSIEQFRQAQEDYRAQMAPRVGEPLSHRNPVIAGKPIVATTGDGRAVVPNPENKGGISVVKHQPEAPAVESRTAESNASAETAIPPAGQPPLAEVARPAASTPVESLVANPSGRPASEDVLRQSRDSQGEKIDPTVDAILKTAKWKESFLKELGEGAVALPREYGEPVTFRVANGDLIKVRPTYREPNPTFGDDFQGIRVEREKGAAPVEALVRPEQTPREVVEAAGLTYLGEQQRPGGKPPLQLFNTPDGATLAIEGDVTPQTVAEKVKAYYEKKAGLPVVPEAPTEVASSATLARDAVQEVLSNLDRVKGEQLIKLAKTVGLPEAAVRGALDAGPNNEPGIRGAIRDRLNRLQEVSTPSEAVIIPDHPDPVVDAQSKEIISHIESADLGALSAAIKDAPPETRARIQGLTAEIAKEKARSGRAVELNPPRQTGKEQTRQDFANAFLKDQHSIEPDDPRWNQGKGISGISDALRRTVWQYNLGEILPEGTTAVYHETSLDNARRLIPRLERFNARSHMIDVSDNIDLALGQGGRGVIIEFDPKLINGVERTANKPMLDVVKSLGGGTEYRVDASYVGSVKALIAKTARQVEALKKIPGLDKRFDFDATTAVERGLRIPRRTTKLERLNAIAERQQIPTVPEEPIAKEKASGQETTPIEQPVGSGSEAGAKVPEQDQSAPRVPEQPSAAGAEDVALQEQLRQAQAEFRASRVPQEPLAGTSNAENWNDVAAEVRRRLSETGPVLTGGSVVYDVNKYPKGGLPDHAKIMYVLEPVLTKLRADASALVTAGKIKAEDIADYIRQGVKDLFANDPYFSAWNPINKRAATAIVARESTPPSTTMDSVRQIAQKAHDFISVEAVPSLNRVGVSGEARAHASARIATPHVVKDMLSQVFPEQYTDSNAMAKTIDVINKDNILGGYDMFIQRGTDLQVKAAKAEYEEKALLKQRRDLDKTPPAGLTPKEVGTLKLAATNAANAAHSEAITHRREASAWLERASKVGDKQDIARIEAEVNAAQSDPQIVANIDRWKRVVNPELDRLYNEAKRVDINTPREERGRLFGARINLLPETRAAEMAAFSDPNRPMPEGVTSNYRNPNVKRDPFMRAATFTGKYSTDAQAVLTNVLGPRLNEVTKLRLVDALVARGAGVELAGSEAAPDLIQGQKPVRLAIKVPQTTDSGATVMVERNLWVRNDLAREVRDVLNTDMPLPANPIAKFLTAIQLAQLTDITAHLKNIHTILASAPATKSVWTDAVRRLPILGSIDSVKRIVGVTREILADTPTIRAEMAQMAQQGLIRPEYPSTGIQKFTHGQQLIHNVDTASRVIMNRFFNNLVERGSVADTPENRASFIQQIGEYNRRLMGPLMRAARDSGLSPFVVAGRNFNRQAVRLLTGNPGIEAVSTTEGAKMRAVNITAGLVAATTLPAILNLATTGSLGGRPGTPIGAWDLGRPEDEKGKHRVVDLFQILGIRRGLRATGLNSLVEGMRGGASSNEIVGNAISDAASAQAHPWLGPALGFAYQSMTGRRLDLRGGPQGSVAQNVGGGGAQYAENVRSALEAQNPLLYSLISPVVGAPAGQGDDSFFTRLGKGLTKGPSAAFGIQDAQSPAMQLLGDKLKTKMAQVGPAAEAAEKSTMRRELAASLRAGQPDGEALGNALESGTLKPSDLQAIYRASRLTLIEIGLKKLGIEDALDVYERMTPAEKGVALRALSSKRHLISNLPQDQQADMYARFYQALQGGTPVPTVPTQP